MIVSVAQWAEHQNISRQMAHRRITNHGIPWVSPGRIDRDVADKIWAESVNPAKQRGGIAAAEVTGANPGRPPAPTDQVPMFEQPAAALPGRSPLAQVQLQLAIQKLKRDRHQLDVEQGKYADRDKVTAFASHLIQQARAALQNIGLELGDDLAREADPIKCRQMVNAKIEAALRDLAAWRPE